jgi:hypothetical protein
MAKKDEKAPAILLLEIKGPDGKLWGTFGANAKEFKTGSVGYYANGKIKNPDNPEAKYQVSGNIILCGSKEE